MTLKEIEEFAERDNLREAIMQLSMCSLRLCKMCIYYHKRGVPERCEEVIKRAQNTLADYCLRTESEAKVEK